MPCCAIAQVGGVPGGGSVVSDSAWTERYLGDFAAAPVVDLADPTPPNPTVQVANDTTTPGQVAGVTWTSNAGDATATVTQGTVTTFDTDGATGLRFVGAVTTSNFTESAQNAPHIWALWSDLLGENVRPGVDYCFLVMATAEPTLPQASQAAGTGIYWPNDGVVEPDLDGNPAIDDEKAWRAWWINEAGTFQAQGREESTPYQGIEGALIPANSDVMGFILYASGQLQCIVGNSVAGDFPDPSAMVRVPGPFNIGSTTFPARPYGTPLERVAIPFQQQSSGSFSATIRAVRVLSRGT